MELLHTQEELDRMILYGEQVSFFVKRLTSRREHDTALSLIKGLKSLIKNELFLYHSLLHGRAVRRIGSSESLGTVRFIKLVKSDDRACIMASMGGEFLLDLTELELID